MAMPRRSPMCCPECQRQVGQPDVRKGNCPYCETKICIPKAYYRPATTISVIAIVLIAIKTFPNFATSPGKLPLVIPWSVMLFVVFHTILLLFRTTWMFGSPPVLERQASLRTRPMCCPECQRRVGIGVVGRGKCSYCETKLCIPKTYYRRAMTINIVAIVLFVIKTFPIFITSPGKFILWDVMLFIVFVTAGFLLSLTWLLVSPPVLERAYANDTFTTLRLND
jgi:uncharacterized protein (DUF779 family)